MSKQLASWEAFNTELRAHEHEIATLLPRHVSKERFLSSALAAVKQNPDLLQATPRSLFQAVTQSAQDGLLPDGREGVITVYNQKRGQGWEKLAKWNPMTHGLRKRARELDHLIIDCQVVYSADHFIWHQGDQPKLEHIPAPLGTARGGMIGAYAIFKDQHGHILHREVMDVNEINAVRSQSKQPDGLLWTKFASEGWKKTVLRRGIKSIPCSENLDRMVHRDDDLFEFGNGKEKAPAVVIQAAPGKKALPPLAPNANGSAPGKEGVPVTAAQPVDSDSPAPSTQSDESLHAVEDAEIIERPRPFNNKQFADYMDALAERYHQAESRHDIEEIHADAEENGYPRMLPMDTPKAERLYHAALERLNG